ncbi:hypothetical protein SAMN04244573_02430 [Azotobacter beijerinckii]|uniref:Uncharacterized protein n=1 Tax=Azotobacter beijerinckii TaxID=170623 RepID=A0A1H9JK71_9GAMM|nr:hypothetical protein SAMN04244573_02430 [Azotobacter beijerinckii]
MATVNPWKKFIGLLPGGVRTAGTVTAVNTARGTSTVELRNGITRHRRCCRQQGLHRRRPDHRPGAGAAAVRHRSLTATPSPPRARPVRAFHFLEIPMLLSEIRAAASAHEQSPGRGHAPCHRPAGVRLYPSPADRRACPWFLAVRTGRRARRATASADAGHLRWRSARPATSSRPRRRSMPPSSTTTPSPRPSPACCCGPIRRRCRQWARSEPPGASTCGRGVPVNRIATAGTAAMHGPWMR